MRDDDDLPVLDAIVRGGDRAVILSTRLGLALDPSRDVRPRPPPTARPASGARGLETDDVARIDLGQVDAHGEGAAGHRPTRAGSRYAAPGHVASVDDRRGADDELDDTLGLDDPSPGRAHAPHPEPHLSAVSPARLPRRAVAANDREAGPADGSSGTDRIERLVDEIVERHVAALRRDVRAALERTLRESGTRRV